MSDPLGLDITAPYERAQTPFQNDSALQQGLRSGTLGAGSQLASLAGGVADAAGAQDFAKGAYAKAGELSLRAQQTAPRVSSYKDVHSLRDAFDYGAGMVGQSVPVAAAGLAAAAATDGGAVPALLAGTAATTPFEVGDVLQRQQQDPQALRMTPTERLERAGVAGLGSAALQNIVPAGVAGKLVGRTAEGAAERTVGQTLAHAAADVPVMGAAGAAGEAVKQVGTNPDKPLDVGAIKEAGVGGAVGALPLAGLGAAGELAHKGAARPAEASAEGAAAPGAAPRAAPGTTPSMEYLFEAGKTPGQTDVDRVAAGQPLGDLDHLATAEGPAAQAAVAESERTTAAKVKDWASQLLNDTTLTPERRAAVAQATQNMGDQANQVTIAGIMKAQEMGQRAAHAVSGLYNTLSEKFGPQEPAAGTKQSADFSGADQLVTNEIAPALKRVNPELMNRPDAVAQLSASLRRFVNVAGSGEDIPQSVAERLYDVFGPETHEVLTKLPNALPFDNFNDEAYHAAIARMDAEQKAADNLRQTIANSLTDESQGTMLAKDIPALANGLMSWAKGETTRDMTPSEAANHNTQVMNFLEQHFGPKADKVISAVEKEIARQAELKFEQPEGADALTEQDTHDAVDTTFHGGGKDAENPGLLLSPDAHRSLYGNVGQAEELMHKLQADNPDKAVRFVPAKEYAQAKGIDPDTLHAATRGEPEKYGVVGVEQMKNPDQLSDVEASRMRLDTSRYANSPARLDVDGRAFDTRAITREMNRKLPFTDSDNISAAHRMARAFMEGIAGLTEKYGKKISVPDDKVIARVGGKDLKFGDIKGMSFSTEAADGRSEPEAPTHASLTKKLDGLRADYKAAKNDDERAAIKARADKVEQQLAKLNVAHDAEARGQQEVGKDEEIHRAAAANSPEDLVHRTNMDGTEHKLSAQMSHAERVQGVAHEMLASHVAAQRALGSKLAQLVENFQALPAAEQQRLISIVGMKSAADRARLINAMAERRGVKGDPQARLEAQVEKLVSATQKPKAAPEVAAQAPKSLKEKQAEFVSRARSGDPELVRQVKESTDAKGLQRAVEHLNRQKVDPNTAKVIDAANERLSHLVQNPDVAYGMQTKRHSLEGVGEGHTEAARAETRDYIKRVLGETARVEFAKMLHAGEYAGKIDGEHLIRVATTALNPQSVGYHEAMHAFFQNMRDAGMNDVLGVLHRAASSAPVMRQLNEFFKSQPDVLKQIADDPEERAAYMYQLWAAKKLSVGDQTHSIFQRIANFVRKMVGTWTNDERALHIMDYFHSGEYAKSMGSPNAVYSALMERGTNHAWEAARKMAQPFVRMGDAVFGAGTARLRDTGVPSLQRLADLIKREHTGVGQDQGFIPSAREEHVVRMNRLGEALAGHTEAEINEALEALQRGTKADSLKARTAQAIVRKTLDDMFHYMRDAGVNVGDLGVGKDYFPRVYDADYIAKHQQEFEAVLKAHGIENTRGTLLKIINNGGNEFGIDSHKPGMQFAKVRALRDIPAAEIAPFLDKNLIQTMNSYIAQGTRRAEWARRFGDDSKGLNDLLSKAKAEGATRADLEMADKAMRGFDGSLGEDLNPTARRAMSGMITYQNIRLLPLAIFSSLVDPMGIIVRGGEVSDAWSAFKRGMGEINKNFSDKALNNKDSATRLAETLGVIDHSALAHSLGSLYAQNMTGGLAKKINNTFFRYNLMEQFNSSMRVAATEAALKFIERHAEGVNAHSPRYLAELGLTKKDVVMKDGRLALTEADGLDPEHALRMRAAVNKWVDGAVLRPDAADKPIWMNDPHWALVAHLKQFVFAFHHTILKRVAHEMANGNYTPAYALASYVPIMIAADAAKGMIQGGGSQPAWKQDWGPADYVWNGVQRGGLLGVGQFGADMIGDVERGGSGFGALTGPTIEQLTDSLRVLGGREQFGSFALNSMPANALYSSAFKGGRADPTFSD